MKHGKNGTGGKKNRIWLGVMLLALACGAAAWFWLSGRMAQVLPVTVDESRITTYEDGDTVYSPDESAIALDDEEQIYYYDNLVIAFLSEELSEQDAAALAKQVNGVVVGNINGPVCMLQIAVHESSLSEIEAYAATLMENDQVSWASADVPTTLTANASIKGDSDLNPWSSSGVVASDLGNEEEPDGNDWWAEAIGAYTAWNIVDSEKYSFTPVKVGIIDGGFDVEHEDLTGKLEVQGNNTPADHGTHVAGIIGAWNNTVGIRGVADRSALVVADASPDGEEAFTIISSGEAVKVFMEMVKNGCYAINLSAGAKVKFNTDMDEFIKDRYQSSHYGGFLYTMLISRLIEAGYEQFMFVQAAGNGFEPAKILGFKTTDDVGIDAAYNGVFCNVDRIAYDKMIRAGAKLADYDEIRSHVMIVGAVENKTDKDGNYEMTKFSNYGDNVDICAPGENILSTFTTKDDTSGKRENGKIYAEDSGTSMSAPMVTGAAALLWSFNPNLTAAQVRNILLTSAKTKAVGVGNSAGWSYPMLNVGAAVEMVLKDYPVDKAQTTDTSADDEQYAGTWTIDAEKTNNSNSTSLQNAYGTGIQSGYHLTLGEDGSFSWGIGIGNGGEGTWWMENGTIYADETEYESGEQERITLTVLQEDGQVRLVQDHYGYTLYWMKEKTEEEKREIYQTAADAYQQFLSSGQYRTAIDTEERWVGSAVQECAGVQWGDSADGYAILDIDGDGTPELLIRSDCGVEDDWYYAAVFSFDADSQKVRLLAELHPYGEITHSDYYSAIQYYDQFSYTSGETDFYTMRNNELALMYSIIFDADYYWGDGKYGRWWYEDSHGTTELRKTDYDTYFQDAEAVEFQPIAADGLNVNENPTKEPEITNNADSADTTSTELTDYYWYCNVQSWEIYEFRSDGTFQVYYTEMPLTPSENTQLSQADLVSSGQSGRYDFDGEKLTIYPDDGASYSMDLYDRSRDPYPDDDAAQYVSDYDGSIYFYETDWEPVEIAGILVTDHSYLVRLGKKTA